MRDLPTQIALGPSTREAVRRLHLIVITCYTYTSNTKLFFSAKLTILVACRTRVINEPRINGIARHESLCSLVDTASDRCAEGHGFDSQSGTRIFSLFQARDNRKIVYFSFKLKIKFIFTLS